MADDLPYTVEYSKSSRASCKTCKKQIAKDSLRLAAIVQSPFHDGKMPNWYHWECFFVKQRPKSTADISHFDGIRWEDQEKIKKKIEESSSLPPVAAKGRKRGGKAAKQGSSSTTGNFLVAYAKSSKSTCVGCQEKIMKDEVRISKKDFESDEGRRYGGLDRWHHVECFGKLREELGYLDTGASLNGFSALSKEDQGMIEKSLPKIKESSVPPVKKAKTEPADLEEEEEMKKQNKKMFEIRDKLKDLTRNEVVTLLQKNSQAVPDSVSERIDLLADTMTFGALKPCEKCNGFFVYKSGQGYQCTGDLTEWTKCLHVTQDPKRKKFKVPKELQESHEFLADYKPKLERRLIRVTAPSTSSAVKKEDEPDGPRVKPSKPRPLKNMEFVILGKTKIDKDTLKKEIAKLGGTVTTKIHADLAAVISTPQEVEKMSKRMEDVREKDIQVVSEDFIEEAKDYDSTPLVLIKTKCICDWGGEPAVRIANTSLKSASKSGKSKFEKSGSGKVKMTVKGAGAVDPDSGLEDKAHVYQHGDDKYTCALALTDIQSHRNSYYKLQILKHDKREQYWLFRSWGRIGTTIGNTKLEELPLEECRDKFRELYADKTGNSFANRANFFKVPGKMYPLDMDHGEEESSRLLESSDIKSNLKPSVQDLIKLIFDVDTMKKVMMEYEIDMDKMPLGKLSKKQIQQAYGLLTELQELLKVGVPERSKLIDASNRFFTLIPHSFGVAGPPILDSSEIIQAKCEMLEALLEMEIAYNLLHAKVDESKNPLDSHYELLNADIDVLEKDSEEFRVIQEYAKNTHAATHSQYELVIEDVFLVNRNGEDKRFKPFRKLHNRKLLWHGSRTTNFAGILSQGLRIAPPEAPVTGYMFGKGIYFADMVSKSANYCCTSSQNPTGLLLLCEVALGNMYERFNADYIEKLPKGKHSTFGRGQTQPDPEKVFKMEGGVEVPYGTAVPAKLEKKTSLLYNEYIVYDVAQVKTRYLVKMNFKYKN